MPDFELDLPAFLLRDLRQFADYNEMSIDNLVLWAVAEKIGELKSLIIERVLKEETYPPEFISDNYPKIISVTPEPNYILHYGMEGGLEGKFDMKELIQQIGVFSVLIDPILFATVKVAEYGDSLEWVAKETPAKINLSVERLYRHLWMDSKRFVGQSDHDE